MEVISQQCNNAQYELSEKTITCKVMNMLNEMFQNDGSLDKKEKASCINMALTMEHVMREQCNDYKRYLSTEYQSNNNGSSNSSNNGTKQTIIKHMYNFLKLQYKDKGALRRLSRELPIIDEILRTALLTSTRITKGDHIADTKDKKKIHT